MMMILLQFFVLLLVAVFCESQGEAECPISPSWEEMLAQVANGSGFLAALDQSGGSTPKALSLYGVPDDSYQEGETSMFDAVHAMRTRIITSESFHGGDGGRIVGAILFEDTMNRNVEGIPTSEYLWERKRVVPFLKIDKGLMQQENGVQLMKPILIPELEALCDRAKTLGVFGTKMRSVIQSANPKGIQAVVDQQFELGKRIISRGLVPIIEPEVDIHSPEKAECEVILKQILMEHLDKLGDDENVILKLSLPTITNFYKEFTSHPRCLRVVALSGGYSRERANVILSQQTQMIGSFSRALTEGLSYSMSDTEFDQALGESIASIAAASATKKMSPRENYVD
jgi:fructose-bisphosphate aldolase class I